MAFKTKKSLGQHFLTDNNIIGKIVDAIHAGKNDRLIEIGPGTGALTRWLTKQYEDLHVIEVDERAIDVLQNEVEGITIHQQDVLKVDWNALVSENEKTHEIGRAHV